MLPKRILLSFISSSFSILAKNAPPFVQVESIQDSFELLCRMSRLILAPPKELLDWKRNSRINPETAGQ
jgi:hypothetical protein